MEQKHVALRVVVFQEGEWVFAQCLEHDIAAQAKTLEDCLHEFERLVVGHIAIAVENGLEPFQGLKSAPARFWQWFEQSKISLTANPPSFTAEGLERSGIVVEPPQVRVAQPQAA